MEIGNNESWHLEFRCKGFRAVVHDSMHNTNEIIFIRLTLEVFTIDYEFLEFFEFW